MSATAMDTLFGMARSLATPVCRGYLPYSYADASLISGTLRAERAGALTPYRAGNIIAMLRWTLKTWVEREETRRNSTAHRIQRTLKPLIAARKPWRDLIVEAHEANARDGFPLTEEEVADLVEAEALAAIPRPVTRRRGFGR